MSCSIQRLQSLFAQALDIEDSALRETFLQRSCAGEPQLLAELHNLLAIDAQWQGDSTGSPFDGLGEVLELAVAAHSMEGMRIGPYRLCELLGQGGMGSVYRAERADGSVQQQVAIKFVRREMLTPHTLRRFQFERQTLAALDHPQIARLLDAAQLQDGTPYLVMEYIDGLPITQYCRDQRIGLRQRLQLFQEVCAAVSHAHARLVVHRDLKPGNILVAGGQPKLLDFGVAKAIAGDGAQVAAELTGTAQRFFSPRYAAPEQLLGQPIGVACDVYALGLLLYELLCGSSPFDFTDLRAAQIEELVVSVPAPLPSSRCVPATAEHPVPARALRGDLDAIVLRCLRKAPAERYRSVEQLQADIARYLRGRPVSARSGHGLYRLRKFVERNRWNVLLVSLAGALLTASIIALWLQNTALQTERDISQQSLGILKDSFAAADPLRAAGADTSARSVLDAARQRIDATRDEQPELFVTLASNIADAYTSLGRLADAQQLYEQSLTVMTETTHPGVTATDLQLRLVGILLAQGQLARAQRELDASRTPIPSVEWQTTLAQLRTAQGRFDEAIGLLRQALTQVRTRSAQDPLANRIRLALAEALRRAGDGEAALTLLSQTLDWQTATLPSNSAQVLRTRMRRVVPLRDAGQLQESLAQAQSVALAIEQTYGASSPTTAYAHSVRGLALQALGRSEEARAAQRQALQIWRMALGADHPNTLRTQFNLAIALQAEPAEARNSERLLREAVRLSDAREGPSSAISLYYRLHLGMLLQGMGEARAALKVLVDRAVLEGLPSSEAENRRRHLSAVESLRTQLCPAAGTELCGAAGRLLAQQTTSR